MARRVRRRPQATPLRQRHLSKLYRDLVEFGQRLFVGEGEFVGRPFEWCDFQLDWLRRTFPDPDRRPRRSILSIARRNGKTATMAIICLAALIGPLRKYGSRIISASRTRKQAAIVFDYMVKMAQVSGIEHRLHIKPTEKEIVFYPSNGMPAITYNAISADATSALGFGLYLAVVDELGSVRAPRDPLLASIRTAMGSYADSLLLIISTQAATDQAILSQMIDAALSGRDTETACVLYSTPEDADPFDEESWYSSNPALGHHRDLADLQNQAKTAAVIPAEYAEFCNYSLNQRINAEPTWLSARSWRRCSGAYSEDVLRRGPCYAGLDLAGRADLCALVLAAEDEDLHQIHTKAYFWAPEVGLSERSQTDQADYVLWRDQGFIRTMQGESVPYDALAAEIAAILNEYDVLSCNTDPYRMPELKYELVKGGFDETPGILTECPQTITQMTPALEAIEHAVARGELLHGGNPVLTYCVSNAVVFLDGNHNRKLMKNRSFGRIDGAVALAMAGKAVRVDHKAGGLTEGFIWA